MWLAVVAGLAGITSVASLGVVTGIAGLGTGDTGIAGSSGSRAGSSSHTGLGSLARLAFSLADGRSTSSLGRFTDRGTSDFRRSTVDWGRSACHLDWFALDWCRGAGNRSWSTSRLAGSGSLGTGVATIAVQGNDLIVIESLTALSHDTVLVAGGAKDFVLTGNAVFGHGDDIAATDEFRLGDDSRSRSRSGRLSSSGRLNGCRCRNRLDLSRNADRRSHHDLGRRGDWRQRRHRHRTGDSRSDRSAIDARE